MNYKNFSQEIFDRVEDLCRQKQGQKLYAAFDADGTLWDTDMGENFFQWQIQNSHLPNLPEDPWGHYRTLRDGSDTRVGLVWLAQINKGQSLEQVHKWAEAAVLENPPLIFESQRRMIELLRKYKVEIFVVTASIKWAVEPGAALLGIDRDHVVGIKTKVQDGIVTDELDGTISWREGKSEALLEKTGGVAPIFCTGNTMGDFYLLQSSSDYKLAVSAASPGDHHYQQEQDFQEIAQKQGWKTHKFH